MLHIHRAERADGLVEALRALLVDPLPDPLSAEVIAVPTRGMERWLTQRMSASLGASPGHSDGVCANVDFPSPRRLLGGLVAVTAGLPPDEDPWLPERAVWPLLEVVDGCLTEPWLHSLAVYLGGTADAPDEIRRARRFSSVRHLAELFDRYALDRPEMLLAWVGGQDSDGGERVLPADAVWQAELWRRLRERIAQASPAERLADGCTRLREDPGLLELAERISLFGLTRLPAGHLLVLRALAVRRDVHLFLLHPSPGLWERIAQSTTNRPRIVRRSEAVTAPAAANRLLASWGQDARDMQLVLAGGDDQLDHHHSVDHPAGTLLAHLQADVWADRSPPGGQLTGNEDTRPVLEPDDHSLQVHACHGRARQVEVLRDAILHVLEEDEGLEPRDIIVMCPDIETFAPLIQATFGAGEISAADHEDELDALPADIRPPDLRVRLADRSVRQTNPVLGVVAQLLDLAEQRLTASQVLDLADREPVRRRFQLDDDDLTRIQDWVAETGIRWGLDAAHRKPFKLDKLPFGTWRAGLDRLLLGVTMSENELRQFSGVLPLDDVESGAIDLAGRFAEFIARLEHIIGQLNTRKPIGAWAETLADAADSLTSTNARDAWQRAELQRLLDNVVGEASAEGAPNATVIALPEVRALLGERLRGRPTRANFRTGHLTICTLVPMRSVPHRVVCLLGLDDGAFPRKAPRDGDDLTLDDPHVGERDPRTEDRQMLLDALLAATDRLIITFTGNDERTNTRRPPAVPVGELLDMVDATVRTEDGRASQRIEIRHPLQPFDPRNFTQGALVSEQTWSFDSVTLGGARALTGTREEPRPFLEAVLPAPDTSLVEIEDLVRFVQHPVKAFLRQRLGISLGSYSDEIEDDLRIELDGLGKWGVGQRLLDARLAGVDGRAATLAEIARGMLPPGKLGEPVVRDVYPIVTSLVTEVQALAADRAPPGSIDVRVLLPDGHVLSGTVPGVAGDLLLTTTYSRLAPKHRLTSWVRLLALTGADPARAFTAATVGRADGGAYAKVARILPLADDADGRGAAALDHLVGLVDLYERGMREPLPLYCATSAAYADAAWTREDPVAAATEEWKSPWSFDKEDREPEHLLVLGGERTFDELLNHPPAPDESGPGWEVSETTRLGRLARRLWDGLLASEERTQR